MILENLFTEQHKQLQLLRSDRLTMPYVCHDSTPVLFFGKLESAQIMTVGINPSWQEFLSGDKAPLAGTARRFAHQSDMSENTLADARLALRRMRDYFSAEHSVAYWRWFSPLEHLVNGCGCSLRAGSAAHTDIVTPFATLPAWGQLEKKITKDGKGSKVHCILNQFSGSGYATFLQILQVASNVKRIFIIGLTAYEAFRNKSDLVFTHVNTPFDNVRKFHIWKPVLREADWPIQPERNLQVIAVGPNWNRPLSPFTTKEIGSLPKHFSPSTMHGAT